MNGYTLLALIPVLLGLLVAAIFVVVWRVVGPDDNCGAERDAGVETSATVVCWQCGACKERGTPVPRAQQQSTINNPPGSADMAVR